MQEEIARGSESVASIRFKRELVQARASTSQANAQWHLGLGLGLGGDENAPTKVERQVARSLFEIVLLGHGRRHGVSIASDEIPFKHCDHLAGDVGSSDAAGARRSG